LSTIEVATYRDHLRAPGTYGRTSSRDASTLDYYRTGSSPDAFATLPKEWTADQVRSFQDYFDAVMSGNRARRRQTRFMPANYKLIEGRQPPLKDQDDERGRASSATPSRARLAVRDDAVDPVRPQRFRGIEQKKNIFLTAYVGFPVAPIFMIWSSDWASAWTRWPCASTALSTRIFLDDTGAASSDSNDACLAGR
jgi:hypothetical protein